jgi:hypothetical protein
MLTPVRMFTAGALVAGALLMSSPPMATRADACSGTSTIVCLGQTWTYAAPVGTNGAGNGEAYASASFDAARGQVNAYASSWGFGAGSSSATDDEFTVTGPGSGPVSFQAVLTCGINNACGSGSALVRRDASHQLSGWCNELQMSAQLPLTIQASIGQTFPLHYEVSASAGPSCAFTMSGQLSFSGLPAGVSVVSCRYLATPVRATTWGRLRSTYR